MLLANPSLCISRSSKLPWLTLSLFLCVSLPTWSMAACNDYQSRINQAVQAQEVDKLEQFLTTLQTENDCSPNYLEWLKRTLAQTIGKRANELVQKGSLDSAEQLLQRAPVMVWITQAIHGDIAKQRKQWPAAAQFYNRAIDIVADAQATPQMPPKEVIEKLKQEAERAQILAGNLDTTVSRGGEATGAMRSDIRGIKVTEHVIPIQFDFGDVKLSPQGEQAAQQLAAYLNKRGATEVILIGHTDMKGSDVANDKVSKKRAEKLKEYLLSQGSVTANITTEGKGKREPLPLENAESYSQEEIDALNRRVEFKVVK